MELPPLPEGTRLHVEEEADAVRISYAVRGGAAARLLLIGLMLLSMASLIGVLLWAHPWDRPLSTLRTNRPLTTWEKFIWERGWALGCLVVFPIGCYYLLNQVYSSGHTSIRLLKDRAVFDIAGGAGVVLVRRSRIRTIHVSRSGWIWIRCRWAFWPFIWATFDLLPGTFRPPTPEDARWIEKVLSQWAGLPS